MGKHEAPRQHTPARQIGHKAAKVAGHHVTHLVTIVSLHTAALLILQKSPILLILGLVH